MSPERKSSAQEEKLDRGSRDELLAELLQIEEDTGLMNQLVFHRPDIVEYADVYLLMAKLIKPKDTDKLRPNNELKEATETHLKRMLAMRKKTMPRISKSVGDEKFWKLIEDRAQDEILKIAGFPRDLSSVPRGWATAKTDLIKLNVMLNEKKAGL